MDALAIFRLVATEFADMPDDDIVDADTGKVTKYGVNSFLQLYSDQISEKRFGKSYQKALAYLTAHKGETSISYTTNQQTNLQVDAEYALTVYGLEFLTLRRNAVIPIISAGEGPGYGC